MIEYKMKQCKVLHIEAAQNSESFFNAIRPYEQVNFIHVDHKHYGMKSKNLIELSCFLPDAKEKLLGLNNRGFYPYSTRENGETTSFVHHRELHNLWHPVKNGDYSIDENGLVYKYEKPILNMQPNRLLVLFSSISESPYTASLIRTFQYSFPSIQEHIAPDTGILRIADLGGVTGSSYMDCYALPKHEQNVQDLIMNIAKKYKISKRKIILFGADKGGCAAFYHGLLGEYKSVAIEPSLFIEDRVEYLHDPYLEYGISSYNRELKITAAIQGLAPSFNAHTAIITSDKLRHYHQIREKIAPLEGKYLLLNSEHTGIKTKSDVAKYAMVSTLMVLNAYLYDLDPIIGYRQII